MMAAPVDPKPLPDAVPDPAPDPGPTLPASAFDELETMLRPRAADEPASVPCEWALVVYAGSQLGRIFPLIPGESTLGRSPQATITLMDEEVSRAHAALRLSGTGTDARVQVQDLDSTNGTLVNGVPVVGICTLQAGDRIGLGSHVLKLVAMDPLERAFHTTLLDQSTRDPLTGLGNRATTLGSLENRFDLSQRHGRPLSVVMCDLDHFKRINDAHGHGAGDMVLQAFGEVVRQNLRTSDLAGRIGGEEFLLVLPETDLEGAEFLAERLRSALADHPLALGGGQLQVTCSLGVAQRQPSDREAGALLGRADAALYLAKAQGRNRVVTDARR